MKNMRKIIKTRIQIVKTLLNIHQELHVLIGKQFAIHEKIHH